MTPLIKPMACASRTPIARHPYLRLADISPIDGL
jgi:hypothetical protein